MHGEDDAPLPVPPPGTHGEDKQAIGGKRWGSLPWMCLLGTFERGDLGKSLHERALPVTVLWLLQEPELAGAQSHRVSPF